MEHGPQTARTPRRRDAEQTKARILRAACTCFAEAGYARTGLRDIAARAGVASSLLVRHFGTKLALFEEAMVAVIAENSVFTYDKANFGAEMARLTVEQANLTITAMLVQAMVDPQSREAAQRVATRHMIAPLAEWLGPPEAMDRATRLFTLMTAFTIGARAINGGEVSPASRAWFAASLQAIVDAGEAAESAG